MSARAKLRPNESGGFMMFQNLKICGFVYRAWLPGVLTVLTACPLSAQEFRIIPVNIYGDGDPLNGIEDSREQVREIEGGKAGFTDQHMSAGTITCDGKFRGTAIVADTREFAPDLKGVVLVSAAHVLFNLDKKKLFRRCRFHFMGWTQTAGYRSKIDLKNVRMGDFDPGQATSGLEFGEGDWAFIYLRKPWRNFNPDQSLRLREFSFSQSELYRRSGGEFRLLAFDSSAGFISESKNCKVIESRSDDLGGGTWKGQLLDDCDSADGASGGGMLAVIKRQYFLIGIRNGSHWSEQVYPVDTYPSGPPDGSVWNRRSNTNFGRAIDAGLIDEIEEYIQVLK
jgi:hypothetical protein